MSEKETKFRELLDAESDMYMELEKEAIKSGDREREIKCNSYKWAFQFAKDKFNTIFGVS